MVTLAVLAASIQAMPSETVLVVDDNVFVLNTISAGLRHAGYTVLPSRTPAEAIEIALQHTDPIHLILLDVILPGMDGPELASQFFRLHPESRALFMSGLPDTPEVAEQILGRGLAFLPKPFLPHALAQKVREVLAAPIVRRMGAL
jgi:two-component system, cell cycle sensor histidine kinase and response regulator CckA